MPKFTRLRFLTWRISFSWIDMHAKFTYPLRTLGSHDQQAADRSLDVDKLRRCKLYRILSLSLSPSLSLTLSLSLALSQGHVKLDAIKRSAREH